jgi:hypothetical protein
VKVEPTLGSLHRICRDDGQIDIDARHLWVCPDAPVPGSRLIAFEPHGIDHAAHRLERPLTSHPMHDEHSRSLHFCGRLDHASPSSTHANVRPKVHLQHKYLQWLKRNPRQR